MSDTVTSSDVAGDGPRHGAAAGAGDLVPPGWPAGVGALFTDRHGGVSQPPFDTANLGGHVGDDPAAVAANRAALVARTGVDRIVWLDQVHGDAVVVADALRPGPGEVPTADAAVTDRPGVALAIMVADCVPVLMVDPVARVVGAAHAGRRGVANGVALATLRAMADLGADPGRVLVALGPAAGGCCYEVPAAMRDELEAVAPGSAGTTTWGTPSLDLRAGLAGRLRAAGVARVDLVGGCTVEDADRFSYRRGARTGRFVGLVWLAGQ